MDEIVEEVVDEIVDEIVEYVLRKYKDSGLTNPKPIKLKVNKKAKDVQEN
jgi:hypothetical protein